MSDFILLFLAKINCHVWKKLIDILIFSLFFLKSDIIVSRMAPNDASEYSPGTFVVLMQLQTLEELFCVKEDPDSGKLEYAVVESAFISERTTVEPKIQLCKVC